MRTDRSIETSDVVARPGGLPSRWNEEAGSGYVEGGDNRVFQIGQNQSMREQRVKDDS